LGSFILDTSRLEGVDQDLIVTPIIDRGRAIELQWSVDDANKDMELLGFAITYAPAEDTTMALPSGAFASGTYAYIETPIEDRGRAITLEWSVDGVDDDMELLGFGLRFAVGDNQAMDGT